MFYFSENILLFPENFEQFVFPNITVLICGYMQLTWEDVKKVSKIFPNVNELRTPYNNITDLSTPCDHNFQTLQYLDLEGNDIIHWSEIKKLSVISSLEHLIIENIRLENIVSDSSEMPIAEFPNLKHININENLIAEVGTIIIPYAVK